MDENFILEIKAKLDAEKQRILGLAEKSRKQDMVLETDDLPDEVDQASSEYNKTIAFRLRGREKKLLSKIDDALEKLGELDATVPRATRK